MGRNRCGVEKVSHNFEILQREILTRSVAPDFATARLEWHLQTVYYLDYEDNMSCACTKDHIMEVCIIENTRTGATLEVGNVCVKKFMPEFNSSLIFQGLGSLRQNHCPNKITTAFLHQKKIITQWEFNFLTNMFRKRLMSPSQSHKLAEILEEIKIRFSLINDEYKPKTLEQKQKEQEQIDQSISDYRKWKANQPPNNIKEED